MLVKDGGMVAVPAAESGAQFNFDFGFAPGMDYGGVGKTMVLTLKGRHKCFTLGKRINRTQVDAIAALAARRGFCRAGSRWLEKPATEAQIERVRGRAKRPNVDFQKRLAVG